MSEPTYLIELSHDPHSETLEWDARVTRIADGSHAVTRWGSTREEAVKAAQAWIRRENGIREPGATFFAREDGEIVVGESVRVLRPSA